MGNEQFEGTWYLVSFEVRLSDGNITYPFGRDAEGTIIYGADGHFSVQVMQRDRPKFASGDVQNGTADEMSTAYKGYVAYYGTYVVDETEGIMTHQVRGSLFPNWVGGDPIRYFKISGSRLTLSTPPMPFDGQQTTVLLVWERVRSGKEEQPAGYSCPGCGTPLSQSHFAFLQENPDDWFPCEGPGCGWTQIVYLSGEFDSRPAGPPQ